MTAEVRVEPDRRTFERLARALERESVRGKFLADLAEEIEDAVEPAVARAKGAVLAMRSATSHGGMPLRTAVAAGVHDEVIVRGRSGGVRVVASSAGMPRGFRQAPKRLNSKRGWRHPVFGMRRVMVQQVGAPGWFDDTLGRAAPAARRGVVRAMEKSVNRIERGAT